MEWLRVKSVEELKNNKNLKKLIVEINNDLKDLFKHKKFKDKNTVNMIVIKSSSWNGLYDKIQALREIIEELTTRESEGYFNSIQQEYLFYLLELDGKIRADKLNITKKCYTNKKCAKLWRDKIAKVIHPDVCKDSKAGEGVIKLNEIYEEMIGHE